MIVRRSGVIWLIMLRVGLTIRGKKRGRDMSAETILRDLGDAIHALNELDDSAALAASSWSVYGHLHYYTTAGVDHPVPVALQLFDAEQHTKELRRLYERTKPIPEPPC